MDNDADKYPHELSGGMRQRVAIARTLILRPRIILMDEPFGALDPETRMNMQDLLVSLWREVQATVFFVTHSIEEAVFLGDRVYVMGTAPGRLAREMEVPPPDRPARVMQREPEFQETVYLHPRLDHRPGTRSKLDGSKLRCVVTPFVESELPCGNTSKPRLPDRWNLLALFGGVGVAAISGSSDVVLPLVLAAEAGLPGPRRFECQVPELRRYPGAHGDAGHAFATQRPGAQAHPAARCRAR